MTVLKEIKPEAEMENDGEETFLDKRVEFPEEWTSELKPEGQGSARQKGH